MAYSAEDVFSQYRKSFVIAPFKTRQVTPLGYDLRVGLVVVLDDNGKALQKAPSRRLGEDTIKIPAGGSAFIVTLERVCLSGKVLGTVHARARLSLRGLMMNSVTVDPNFGLFLSASMLDKHLVIGAGRHSKVEKHNQDGHPVGSRLLLRVNNVSSKVIELTSKNDAVATLVFHEVNTDTKRKPKLKDMPSLISELRKALKSDIDESVWRQIQDYLNTTNFDHQDLLDPAEEELLTAMEEMLHYRESLRHGKQY
jgi:deoxycytidine triphosphate deaminase